MFAVETPMLPSICWKALSITSLHRLMVQQHAVARMEQCCNATDLVPTRVSVDKLERTLARQRKVWRSLQSLQVSMENMPTSFYYWTSTREAEQPKEARAHRMQLRKLHREFLVDTPSCCNHSLSWSRLEPVADSSPHREMGLRKVWGGRGGRAKPIKGYAPTHPGSPWQMMHWDNPLKIFLPKGASDDMSEDDVDFQIFGSESNKYNNGNDRGLVSHDTWSLKDALAVLPHPWLEISFSTLPASPTIQWLLRVFVTLLSQPSSTNCLCCLVAVMFLNSCWAQRTEWQKKTSM